MGYHFTWKSANWLAHILKPSGIEPKLDNQWEAKSALKALLDAAPKDFYAARDRRSEFWQAVRQSEYHLHDNDIGKAIRPLRTYFRDVPWTALLVPSGDREIDGYLCSRDLLGHLVNIRPTDPGLILQIDEPFYNRDALELDNIFPAFRVAMANATRWPGVLIWTANGDAVFLELERSINAMRESLQWLFSHLAVIPGTPDLEVLRLQFQRKFESNTDEAPPLRIIHLSDLHLGSNLAQRRLPRVKQLIRQLVAELGEASPIVPVITGDLMDTPDDSNYHAVSDFLEFLYEVGSEKPIVVLGNHDVRRDGWMGADLQNALRMPVDRVRWIEKCKVGFACFNSVRSGNLACGKIDESEYLDVGQALDRSPEFARNFVIGALLHHHPTPVVRPTWYHKPWHEWLLGRHFEKTEALESADVFLNWLQARRIGLVLHGHKHIPRVETNNALTIVGCGSSVGKVETELPGTTYMSMNVVTVDADRGRISCRLRAERIPGGGLTAEEQHEAILNSCVSGHRHNPAGLQRNHS